jgi:hypothetical protein
MKKKYSFIPVYIVAFVLVLSSWNYIFLSVAGHAINGEVVYLSASCKENMPNQTKPTLKAQYTIEGRQHVVSGGPGYGNPDFCNLKIGSEIILTVFGPVVTVGDAKSKTVHWAELFFPAIIIFTLINVAFQKAANRV